jgi:hypothetical protein
LGLRTCARLPALAVEVGALFSHGLKVALVVLQVKGILILGKKDDRIDQAQEKGKSEKWK